MSNVRPIMQWGTFRSPHLSLSSAAFSASSSFCSAVPSLSCARSNSSSTSWILRFRAATSASAWKHRVRDQCLMDSHVRRAMLCTSFPTDLIKSMLITLTAQSIIVDKQDWMSPGVRLRNAVIIALDPTLTDWHWSAEMALTVFNKYFSGSLLNTIFETFPE